VGFPSRAYYLDTYIKAGTYPNRVVIEKDGEVYRILGFLEDPGHHVLLATVESIEIAKLLKEVLESEEALSILAGPKRA